MSYIVTPYKRPPEDTVALAMYDIQFVGGVCRPSLADEFVVSFVANDGSIQRVATFINHDDVLLFLTSKGS